MTPGHSTILCEKDVNKYCSRIRKKVYYNYITFSSSLTIYAWMISASLFCIFCHWLRFSSTSGRKNWKTDVEISSMNPWLRKSSHDIYLFISFIYTLILKDNTSSSTELRIRYANSDNQISYNIKSHMSRNQLNKFMESSSNGLITSSMLSSRNIWYIIICIAWKVSFTHYPKQVTQKNMK